LKNWLIIQSNGLIIRSNQPNFRFQIFSYSSQGSTSNGPNKEFARIFSGALTAGALASWSACVAPGEPIRQWRRSGLGRNHFRCSLPIGSVELEASRSSSSSPAARRVLLPSTRHGAMAPGTREQGQSAQEGAAPQPQREREEAEMLEEDDGVEYEEAPTHLPFVPSSEVRACYPFPSHPMLLAFPPLRGEGFRLVVTRLVGVPSSSWCPPCASG
jgi:hypothetical protein